MIDTEQMVYFKIMLETFTLYSLLLPESVEGASLFVNLIYTYTVNLHFKIKKYVRIYRCIYVKLGFAGEGPGLVPRYNLYPDHLLYIT